MPIVDVLLVSDGSTQSVDGLAKAIADGLGAELGEPPGRLWVRLLTLPSHQYAENQATVGLDELPVFVTFLIGRPPDKQALQAHAQAVCSAVARLTGRSSTRVHVEYAPAAVGRIAFGGRLVT